MGAILAPTTMHVAAPIDQNGYANADIVKAVHALWIAIQTICLALDDSSTGYVTGVQTPLDAALANLHTPGGPTA